MSITTDIFIDKQQLHLHNDIKIIKTDFTIEIVNNLQLLSANCRSHLYCALHSLIDRCHYVCFS